MRVLYNRVYSGKFPCNCLQVDSTVNYYLRITGKGAKPSTELLNSELHNKNNPYNTHDVPGLPIGPISNPGTSALKAAIEPAEADYYYFCAIDTAGNTGYAKTYKEFQAMWDQAQARTASSRCVPRSSAQPVSHSRSPAIHNAGYAAAGLRDWSYTAIECGEAGPRRRSSPAFGPTGRGCR